MDTNKIAIPLAIVVAGGLIAGALYFSNIKSAAPAKNANQPTTQKAASAENMKPVSADDHILGDPNAELLFVEYSDTECPYCKEFHLTLQQMMKDYGSSGKIAWVYRHFPISQLHSKAPKENER
jgi:protein-disulfide isomerase